MGESRSDGGAPFAADVFRWRAVAGAEGVEKPTALDRAEFFDEVLKTYPGYTLDTLASADAYRLLQHRALLDDDLGKAES